ncbi:MAG: hypothetical protein KGM24_00415 [Elusimicrobia bacterium]|nr:hypothetical protein [Elusimicrobiota bacterium]
MTRRRGLAVLLAVATAAACAPPAAVLVSQGYDPAQVRRVALVSFSDYPGAPGSGAIAAGTFDKYLLLPGYQLLERRQVDALLREKAFDLSGAVDQTQLRRLGKLLGVDALAFGTLTNYAAPGQQTELVDMPLENTNPVYGRVVTTRKNRGARVTTIQDVVTGYSTTRRDAIVPQTSLVPAQVGLSVRLVDVETGTVLWSVSASAVGSDLPSALEDASAQAMRAVVRQLRRAGKRRGEF